MTQPRPMTAPDPSPSDDAVLFWAMDLGMTIPKEVDNANNDFGLMNLLGGGDHFSGDWVPAANWQDVLGEWRKTSDYARACAKALEEET